MKLHVFLIALIIIVVIGLSNQIETYEDPDVLPVLVISIPGSKRREKISKMFDGYKGRFRFSDGIIAKTDEDRRYHLKKLDLPESLMDKMLTKGELGCALAHVYAYKYIIDNKLPRALILEDDVEFTEEGGLDKLSTYEIPENEPHMRFLHGADMYGFQAQVVTQEGAQALYNHRDKLICDAIDIVVWHKRIPVHYSKGPVYFKHSVPFNDESTSERIQINHGF